MVLSFLASTRIIHRSSTRKPVVVLWQDFGLEPIWVTSPVKDSTTNIMTLEEHNRLSSASSDAGVLAEDRKATLCGSAASIDPENRIATQFLQSTKAAKLIQVQQLTTNSVILYDVML